ncbi:MAG: hypothetical protein ACRC68_09195 [Clostridium sp.]
MEILELFNLSKLAAHLDIPYGSLKNFKRGESGLKQEHLDKLNKFIGVINNG